MTYTELVTLVSDYCENTFPTTDMNAFIRQAEQRIYNTVQLANLRKNVTGTITSGNKYLSCPDDFLSVYSLAVFPAGGGEYLYLINKDVNFMREAYPNPATTGKPKHYAIFGPQSNDTNELSFMLGPTPSTTYSAELHYYYYPPSIVQGVISAINVYQYDDQGNLVDGTYYNVPITTVTNVSGNSAKATIVVSAGVVQSVTITDGGCGYAVNTVITCSDIDLGRPSSGGSPFFALVTAVSNPTGTTWLGDNFDSALLYGTMCEAITYIKGEPDMVKLYQDRYVQAIALLKNLGDGKQRADAYRDGQVRVQVS